nr:hypothetical protein CFP56_07895 [Quercus suber]
MHCAWLEIDPDRHLPTVALQYTVGSRVVAVTIRRPVHTPLYLTSAVTARLSGDPGLCFIANLPPLKLLFTTTSTIHFYRYSSPRFGRGHWRSTSVSPDTSNFRTNCDCIESTPGAILVSASHPLATTMRC